MVSLTEKTTIPLPAAKMWPLLREPALARTFLSRVEQDWAESQQP